MMLHCHYVKVQCSDSQRCDGGGQYIIGFRDVLFFFSKRLRATKIQLERNLMSRLRQQNITSNGCRENR